MNFICLIFLTFVVTTSTGLDYQDELCFDKRIDAAFSFSDKLVLFKGKKVYRYTFEEVDLRKQKKIIKPDTKISLPDLQSEKDVVLKNKIEQTFSEFCGNDFSAIRSFKSAFYDKNNSKAFLVESNKNSVVEIRLEEKIDCSSIGYEDFTKRYGLRADFDQVLQFNDKNVEFVNKIIFLRSALEPTNKSNKSVGLIKAIDLRFPTKFNAIVNLASEIWIFKDDKILSFRQDDFQHKINSFERIDSKKITGTCDSETFKLIDQSLIILIEDKINSTSLTKLDLNESSIVDKFECDQTESGLIISRTSVFVYFGHHLFALFLMIILIILIFTWITSTIYYVITRRERIKNFYRKRTIAKPVDQNISRSYSEDEVTSIRLPIGSNLKSNKMKVQLTKFKNQISNCFKPDLAKNLPKTNLESVKVSRHMEPKSFAVLQMPYEERSIE